MFHSQAPKKKPWTKEWTHLRPWLCHLMQQIRQIGTSTIRLSVQRMPDNWKILLNWIFRKRNKSQQKQWSVWISWIKKKRNKYYLHNERLKLVQFLNMILMKRLAHAKSLSGVLILHKKLSRNQHRRHYLLESKQSQQKERNQIIERNNWWHWTNQLILKLLLKCEGRMTVRLLKSLLRKEFVKSQTLLWKPLLTTRLMA